MGTEVILTASLDSSQQEILTEAEKVILDFEKRFSRFVAGNELSEFNNRRGGRHEVSPTLAELLTAAQRYYLDTKGIFDPTIISNLEAVGYDRSFELTGQAVGTSLVKINFEKLKSVFTGRSTLRDLKIDGRFITCPAGLRVDLGGIGKGYIIDYLSQNIFLPVADYWISAGGDIIAAGHQAAGQGWDIGVQNPLQPETSIFSLNTRGQKLGIATSGIIKRQGRRGDFVWHHLIDPHNGLPVINDILSVTAISSSATRADIFAKTVLILGLRKGLTFIEKQADSAAIIFTKNKKPIFSQRVSLYL